MKRLFRKIWNQKGQAAVLLAAALPFLLGFMTLSLDAGRVFVAHEKLQSAADAAALAGASYLPGDTSQAISAAVATAVANGVPKADVAAEIIGSSGNQISVSTTNTLSLFFGPLIGIPSATTGAVSVREALVLGAVLALLAFLLVLTTNAAAIAWSFAALAIAIAYPYAKRYVSDVEFSGQDCGRADRGFLVADTKLELGIIAGELAICDEVLTPDSSRFWPAGEWEPGTVPPAFDPALTGQAVGLTESPRGALVHYVHLEGGRIVRYHMRTASFANWPLIMIAARDNPIGDFPLINKSLELCYACADR